MAIDTSWFIKHNIKFKNCNSFNVYFIDCTCRSSMFQQLRIKKVNQRKIKFYCERCKTSKTVIIPRGFSLCKMCQGTGAYIKKDLMYVCEECDKGLIAWTEVTK